VEVIIIEQHKEKYSKF